MRRYCGWRVCMLGDHTLQSLLDTIVFCNGLFFALRSGREHWQLRSSPCQIDVVEWSGQRPYLKYTEDISKNHPGSLKGRNAKPEVVSHHANTSKPKKDASFIYLTVQTAVPTRCSSIHLLLAASKEANLHLLVFKGSTRTHEALVYCKPPV